MSIRNFMKILAAVVTLAAAASAQDGNYMVRYATNLNPPGGGATDTVINITNTGASFGLTYQIGRPDIQADFPNTAGFVCANVYVFSPDEQLQACCQCNLSPNALASYSAIKDLINNTLTTAKPNSIVVKVVGTVGFTCNAGTAGQPVSAFAGGQLFQLAFTSVAPGLAAWARNAQGGETALRTATLTAAELARATALCAFNQVNGSGAGVCNNCTRDGR